MNHPGLERIFVVEFCVAFGFCVAYDGAIRIMGSIPFQEIGCSVDHRLRDTDQLVSEHVFDFVGEADLHQRFAIFIWVSKYDITVGELADLQYCAHLVPD